VATQNLIIHSPGHAVGKVIPLLEPRSLRDSKDGSYWTILRIPGLAPHLDQSDPDILIMNLHNTPPKKEELEEFPSALQAAIDSFSNAQFLNESNTRKLNIKILPPDQVNTWEREVSIVGKPPHHVIVHWQLTEEKKVALY